MNDTIHQSGSLKLWQSSNLGLGWRRWMKTSFSVSVLAKDKLPFMISAIDNDLWWVPDEHDVWTLASQSGVVLPNGLVSFTVHKTKKVIAMQLEKCLRAVKDQGTPEDLIQLPDVNPASILSCVRARFLDQKIYTSIGMVLMSVNPFRVINGLYGKNIIKSYEDPMAKNLPSHVYMVPSRAYYDMCTSGCDQSILISGESGAGKTEATKQCLNFLTEVANSAVAAQSFRNDGSVTIADISDRIIAASPILEAFGNAQTLRNPNSSRFGKWMILNFDSQNIIHSANIISYLLEKSRVTQRDNKERNYHIFYQVIRGIGRDQLIAWHIDPSTRAHKYLSQGDREAPDLNDAKVYKETFQAFLKMGFANDEIIHLFKIVMAILQLGDIVFQSTRDGEGSQISNIDIVEQVAKKLSVSQDILTYALCNRSIESGKGGRKSVVAVQLNQQKAQETRDSLARFIYDKVFLDIISTINAKSKDNSAGKDLSAGADRGIGLLDIFGFEIFIENSFEQLCINYCNEMLQNHFNFVIFTAEKQLYDTEGVTCETIEFRDNIDVIREVESAFKALDEEGRIPRGTSKTWFDKLKKVKMANIVFPTRKIGDIFSVKHYAGNVDYNAIGFLEKNVETLNNDLMGAMSSSVDPVVHRVFVSTQQHGDAPSSADRRPSTLTPVAKPENPPDSKDASSSTLQRTRSSAAMTNRSLSWRFINQLSLLMNMLKRTKSHFIRCIKSNDECAALKLESSVVYKQLIYSGVFEVVKIQQSGLPCRLVHDDYLTRYRCLAPSDVRFSLRSSTELIAVLTKLKYDLSLSRIGTTMTFYKSQEQRLLEAKRDGLLKEASTTIACFFQMKTRQFLYKNLLNFYKRFQSFNADLDLLCATDALEGFLIYCGRMQKVVRYDVLSHVIKYLEKELSLLDSRVQLIQDARHHLANRTQEGGVDSLEQIVSRAIDLEITSHSVVMECRTVIQKFYRALEFVNIVKGPPEEGGASRRMSVIVSNLRALSSEQIHEGMELLNQMSDLVEDATHALKEVASYRSAVDIEIETKMGPLQDLFGRSCVGFDSRTGNLIFKQVEGQGSFNKMKRLVSSLDADGFKCYDMTMLFEDCVTFIKLMDDFVAINDARSALQLLREYTSSRVSTQTFLAQIPEFNVWGDIQLSADTLRDLSAQGCVPNSATIEAIVDVVEIEKVLEKLRALAEPSENVQVVIRAGDWIIKWRKAYLASDWESLEEIVQDADQDGVEFFIFDDFPDCIDELNNCQWQVIYHGLYSDVVAAITESVFRLISFETESWLALVADLTEELAMIDDIREFADTETSPKLLEILPLLEKLIQLRSLIYAEEVEFAKQLIQDIRNSQGEIIKNYFFAEAVNSEIEASEKLMKKIEYERQLDSALRDATAMKYSCLDENEQVKYATVVNLTTSIVALQDTLQALGILSATYNRSLQQKIAVANVLLSGRRYLQMDESDVHITWKDYLKSFQSSVDSLRDEENQLDEGYLQEFQIIIEEMHRRMLLQGFNTILVAEVVIGNVDVDVHVESVVLSDMFHKCNQLILVLKSSYDNYPMNLRNLAKFARSMLQLRKYIHDNKVWNHEGLRQCIQRMQSAAHGGGMLLLNVEREFTLLKAEMAARESIKLLKHELQYIQINMTPEADSQLNVLVNLVPLQEAMEAAKGNIGEQSKQVMQVAAKVVILMTNLIQNETDKIDNQQMEIIVKGYAAQGLDSSNMEIIFDRVRTFNFLRSLNDLLMNHAEKPEELFREVQKIQASLKSLPEKFIPWLHTAFLYCYLSDALGRKSWIEIIEVSQEMDEYMSRDLQATLQAMLSEHTALDNNFSDAENFIKICTDYKLSGFHKAIQMKNEQDELEKVHRNQQLSPIESLKVQLRQEDMSKSMYGIGQMRKAGFSDTEICNLNFPARLLWAYNFEVNLLHKQQYPARELLHAGYTVPDLYRSGYTVFELFQSGVEIGQLLDLGLTLQQLRVAGIPDDRLFTSKAVSLSAIKEVECEPQKLFKMGFALSELVQAGFGVAELRGSGFSATEIFHAGHRDLQDFIHAGFSSARLTGVFPLKQLAGLGGLSFNELKKAGVQDHELAKVGFGGQVERRALMALYSSTDGPHWRIRTNWATNKPISQWYGISVEADHKGVEQVVSVDLVDNCLRGQLPEDLSQLRSLRRLRLASNPDLLVGDLPAGLLRLIHDNGVVTDILPYNAAQKLLGRKLSFQSVQQGDRGHPHPHPQASITSITSMHNLFALLPAESQQSEREALVEIFRSLHGPKWKNKLNWCSAQPVNKWYGVKVDKDGFVVELQLASNGLRGNLPDSIGSLQHLQVLDLRLNQIAGFIPQGLAYCFKLQNLHLQANKLCGGIPAVLQELTDLVVLDLRSNLLQGEFPYSSFENLQKLKYLGIYSNHVVANKDKLQQIVPTCKVIS